MGTQSKHELRPVNADPDPVVRTPRTGESVAHGRPARWLATSQEPAVGGQRGGAHCNGASDRLFPSARQRRSNCARTLFLDHRLIATDVGRPLSDIISNLEGEDLLAEDTAGRKIHALGHRPWDIPVLRRLLEDILPREQVMEGYVVEHDFPGLGRRRMALNARRIVTAAGDTELILLAMVAIEPLDSR